MGAYDVHPLMFLGRIMDLDTLDNKYSLDTNFVYCCFDGLLNSIVIGYHRPNSYGYAA